MMVRRTRSRIKATMLTALLMVLLGLGTGMPSGEARAQETVQISILNVPGVLPSPFISDLESDIVSGRYQVQVTYIPSGVDLNPVELQFRVRMYLNRELLVDERSLPATFDPGTHILSPVFDRIQLESSLEDVLTGVRGSLQRQMIQTGALPEGDYRLELDVEILSDQRFNIIPGQAYFTVSYPQPPQLMTPGNQTNLTMSTPVFSWSPVLTRTASNLDYEFLLVEVFPGQSPEDAIDANRPHHEQTLMNVTSFVYTPDLYPLESGRTYAWMVRAFEVNDGLPIRNDGESELFTFTYDDSEVRPEDLANLERIPLVPGMAWVVNPQELDVEDIGPFFELNGTAEVEFGMNYLESPVRARANVNGLTIQKTGLDNPVVTGGQVNIYVERIADLLIGENQWVSLRDFEYRFGVGISGAADLQHESFGSLSATGEISLTHSGLEGTLRAEGTDLLRFDHDLFTLSVNRIVTMLPDRSVYADASIEILGRRSPCELRGMDLSRDMITTGWICDQTSPITLGGDSENLVFNLNRTSGSVSIDQGDMSMEYSVTVRGGIDFNFMSGQAYDDFIEPCGISVRGEFDHESFPEFTLLRNTCSVPEPKLDLGFARLGLHDIELESLSYDPASGNWDFAIPFEASIYFPLFDNWEFEHTQPFRLTPTGIDVPQFSLDSNLPSYDHDALRLSMQSLILDRFTFPWFDWDPTDPGPWNLEFEAEAAISESAGLPSCLRNAVMSIDNGRVTSGAFSADLQLSTLDGCTVPIVAGHNIIVSAIGGSIASEYHAHPVNPFTTTADFYLDSRYEPGEPLFCQDGEATQQATADVTFSSGNLAGTLSVDDTGCRIPIGMMEATLDQAELQLFADDGVQNAHLSSQATLVLSQDDAVQGSFVFDIRQQQFLELDFSITDPFTWDIPNEQEPVLSFLVSQASLGMDGLFIDGRQQVQVGDQTFGVTFDNVLVDLYDWRISSGEIFFDQHFALAVSFDEGLSAPKFSAIPLTEEDAPVDRPERGIYLELGADIVVDSTGIRTSGKANASASIGEFAFEDLSVEFTDDFAFQLKPFGVGEGRVDFFYSDNRVAYFDAAGFTPLLSGFANEILPEKLPLPTTHVAYLLLRNAEGDLVVDFEEPEPGIIALSTRPGESLQMVLPILDSQNPPVIGGVQFEDFSITATPGNFRVETGQAWVTRPEDDVLSGLLEQLGLPFDLSEIRYGYTELMSDAGDYLQLAGNLKLFEHTVAADDNMLLKISGGGLVTADFDFQDMDAPIPMFAHTDLLQLVLRSLSGSIVMPVLDGGGVSFDIDIGADLKLGSGTDSRALTSVDLKLQPGNISFSSFASIELDDPLSVELAGFAMNLNSITSIPVFEYDSESGWQFLFALDADFEFTLPGYDPFELPINGLQLSNTGFSIPAQEVNNSTLNGYELPSFELAGFTFQPLALRTLEPVTFNWFEGELSPIQPYFDFEVRLPEIANEHLEPPEGFTFSNVTFQDGFLTGTMEPFEPIGGLVVPAGPPALNPPNLRISEINGALGSLEEAGEYVQNIEISLAGTMENIPFFENEDPDCDMDVTFALNLEGGVGFSGVIDNLVPCGSAEIGPITLSAGSGTLAFSYEDEQQEAIFDGSLMAALEGPQGPFTAQGAVQLDLIAGRITGGQIAINTPFNLSLPVKGSTPFMEFVVQNAMLDRDGFMIDASGVLKAGEVDVNVVFDELLLSLPGLGIEAGEARISAGMGLQIGFIPLTASITGAGDNQPPPGEALLISAESTVILNADGLKYDGEAGASLRLGDQEFANLRTVFEEDFTFRLTSPSVKTGRALVYLDLDGPADEPLVIFDSNGFRFGGGLMAFIPDTLGLPTQNIAYAVIRDEEGEMLLNLDSSDDGGYILQTGSDPLPIYFPALAAADGSVPEVLAHFNLTTDALFVPNSGSVSVTTELDLEPYFGAPISIDSIGLDAEGDLLLTTVLSVTLPEVFGGQKATAQTTIGPDGFQEAIITAGTYTDVYDPTLEHFIERDVMALLSGDDEQSEFIVGLYGARVTINSPADIQLAGSVSTSLLQKEEDQNFGLFYTVGYGPGGWDFNVETQGTVPEVNLGRALLKFDEHEPFDFEISDNEFIIKVSGTVSFEEMIGESLSFSVDDLEFGATNLQASPQLVLRLGAATALLPDQTFDFFSGALTGNISGPSLSFTGRTFSASVSSGDLTFLDKSMEYNDLYVDTQGSFSIGSIAADEVEILQQYLVLKSLGIAREEETGLSLSGTLGFLIPDPLDVEGELFLEVGRDAHKAVYFNSEINVESGFDPDEEYTVNLGSSIAVTLTDQLINIDPFQLDQTEIAVAARVTIFGEDRIFFGEPNNLVEKPGISVKMDRDPVVMYNATGNVGFKFKQSFFEIDIAGDVVSSNEEMFMITLNGQAGFDITGIGGKVGFSGMTITSEGLTDIGNFSGEAKFDLMDIATLELGRFIRKQDDDGFILTVADGFDAGPSDLRESEDATQDIEVLEFLCFGPCEDYAVQEEGSGTPTTTASGTPSNGSPALYLTLGGSSNNSNGAFSGGIHQILFYRTTTGVTFSVEQFQVELGDLFAASASLLYQTSGTNMTLLAAGSGEFAVGSETVGAMIAGSFSNIDDELSFGVFAAVRASMGIDIVPGVVALTGFGGGFFYNPTDQMLNMVTDAVDVFRSDPPEGIERAGAERPGSSDISFAVLLLAEFNLIGAAGVNLLAGSTFMEITNQYFYMDADGIIMGLDGSSAPGLLAGGGISAQIGRNPNNPEAITMNVNLQASLRMMPMMSGRTTGDGIQFMLTKTEQDVVWGIMGGVEMELYGGLIGGGAFLLASNDGFLFEVDFWASLDPPIITVEASIEGSIWYLTYEGVDMPLGAYVIGSGEISALITVTAEIKAAFVQRGGRYELFGMGEGCIGGGTFQQCLAGWFQIKTDPLEVDGGLNPGDRSQLFEDAKAQRDEFEQMVTDAMNNLQTEMERPVVPGVNLDEHLLTLAGYNLMMTTDAQRGQWHNYMVMNEQAGNQTVPQILQDLQLFEDLGAFFSFLESGNYRNETMLNNNSATSFAQAESDLETRLSLVESIAAETVNRLDESIIKAIEYETQASQAMEQMFSLMTVSPVTSIYKPQGIMNENDVPDFEINTDLAEDQSEAIGGLVDAIEALESQIHAVVDSIEHNLGEMDNLLGMAHVANIIETGVDNPTINTVSQMYGETLEAVDRYYSLLANSYWHKINAAGMVNNMFGLLSDQLDDAVSVLHGRLESAYQNRSTNPTRYATERNKAATRVWFVEALAQDADNINFPSGQNFSGFPLAQQAYNDLGDPEVDDFRIYEENTRDLWINMHTLGNRRYMYEKARFIVNELNQNYIGTRESLLAIMRINTELIDDFYDLKSGMLANLYHIIDNYVEIRMQVNPDDEEGRLSAYQTRRQEILQLLEPPVLSKVTVDTDYMNHHYFGTAEVMWEASHPMGIAEASIHITQYEWDDTGIDVGHGQYATIGNTDSFTYTAFKSMFDRDDVLAGADWLNTSIVNVGIRLRSQGGATASRRAVFNMQVGSGGVSTSPGQNLLPASTLPPEQMYVHLEHFYNKGTIEESGFFRDPQGRTHFYEVEEDIFWTGQPEYINIRALVKETETNILKYEYAVGSSQSGDDIIGWTDLVGTRSNLFGTVWDFYTEDIIGQTRILNMVPGEKYYVSVRAYNMNEQFIEANWPNPVVYDNVPPTTPGSPSEYPFGTFDPIVLDTDFSGISYGGTAYEPYVEPRPFVTTAPIYSLTSTQQNTLMYQTDVKPSLGTTWWTESTDNESGLWRYEYLVTTAPEVSDSDFVQGAYTTQETQVQIVSGVGKHQQLSFDFTDQMYVHIRAVNNAKVGSDVLRYGPMYPIDPTPPSEPVVVGMHEATSIKAYLTKRSYDAESGIVGHQYSIGTSPGASDVRPWPDDDTMDFTNTSIIPNFRVAPAIDIPTNDLPWRTNLYINVRAINGQGTKSKMAATGPFVLDLSMPTDPIISLTDRVGDNLEVKIDGLLYEDLSTLDKIEVRVLYDDGTTTTPLYDWKQVGDSYTSSTTSKLTNFNIGSDYDKENIKVEVKLTNTAGLETTATETLTTDITTDLETTTLLNGSTTYGTFDPIIPRF